MAFAAIVHRRVDAAVCKEADHFATEMDSVVQLDELARAVVWRNDDGRAIGLQVVGGHVGGLAAALAVRTGCVADCMVHLVQGSLRAWVQSIGQHVVLG